MEAVTTDFALAPPPFVVGTLAGERVHTRSLAELAAEPLGGRKPRRGLGRSEVGGQMMAVRLGPRVRRLSYVGPHRTTPPTPFRARGPESD